MIILLASSLFSGLVLLAIQKYHQQEQAKALVLAKAQRRQIERRQRPF